MVRHSPVKFEPALVSTLLNEHRKLVTIIFDYEQLLILARTQPDCDIGKMAASIPLRCPPQNAKNPFDVVKNPNFSVAKVQ
jgi:hypothetical protein